MTKKNCTVITHESSSLHQNHTIVKQNVAKVNQTNALCTIHVPKCGRRKKWCASEMYSWFVSFSVQCIEFATDNGKFALQFYCMYALFGVYVLCFGLNTRVRLYVQPVASSLYRI